MALRSVSLSLVLALTPLGGCKALGMRTIPTEVLEHDYEKPASRYLAIDGTKVHVTVEGKGPPVLMLHGELASLHAWDTWVPLLRESFTVVRMDLPGFGLSDSFDDDHRYTPEYAVEFLDKTRKKLGYEKLDLVGNALGGLLAWNYAAQHPEHVDKLILIDPAAYPQDSDRLFGALAQVSAPRFAVKRNLRKMYGNPDAVSDETIDRYHSLLLHEGHRHAMVQYDRVLEKYAESDELTARIPAIQARTLLMWGEKDRRVPRAQIERWQQDLPQIEVRTYPEGGHFLMEEMGEETARDAYAFLTGGEEPPAPQPSASEEAPTPVKPDFGLDEEE